jgi:vesicle coat complex subunit
MQLFLLNILAILISVSSIHFEIHTEINFKEGLEDALSVEHIFDQSPLRNPSNKNSYDHEILSLNFIETANFAASLVTSAVDFLYYLPIYSLIRAKDYFLLI